CVGRKPRAPLAVNVTNLTPNLTNLTPNLTVEGRRVMTSINERAKQLGPELLGNYGLPYSPVCAWETDAGTVRFQQWWNVGLLEYPTSQTPGGRDCLVIREGAS